MRDMTIRVEEMEMLRQRLGDDEFDASVEECMRSPLTESD